MFDYVHHSFLIRCHFDKVFSESCSAGLSEHFDIKFGFFPMQNNSNRFFRNYRIRTFRNMRNKWSDRVLTVRFVICFFSFGAKVASPSTGVVWNNEMDDFSLPDRSNYFGFPPSPANYIEGGKRMESSMSPIIIRNTKDERVGLEF